MQWDLDDFQCLQCFVARDIWWLSTSTYFQTCWCLEIVPVKWHQKYYFSVFHWPVSKHQLTRLLPWKNHTFPPKHSLTAGHKFLRNISIDFCESVSPSTGAKVQTPKYEMQSRNITDVLWFLPLPKHSGGQTSFALPTHELCYFDQLQFVFRRKKITNCHSLLMVQPRFCLHQETRRTLLDLMIIREFFSF